MSSIYVHFDQANMRISGITQEHAVSLQDGV